LRFLRYFNVLGAAIIAVVSIGSAASGQTAERSFPQSKATVEETLKNLKTSLSGRLPVLEGFALASEYPLNRYERGYYQSSIEVKSTPGGGSVVRVSTKVTAWYADPKGAKSGYQLLPSNGRLEADLLDQLEDALAKNTKTPKNATEAVRSSPAPSRDTSDEAKSAPPSSLPTTERTLPAPSHLSLPDRSAATGTDANSERSGSSLQAEYDSLQETLKNTAHPKNLVAVKKSGTPVVSTPSLSAKPQFLASIHDEFELLDFNADWVHVRISGLSRGWIWRNSVEMPEGIADTDAHPAAALVPAADLFRVIREETAQFPGDWEPLRSQKVQILSVQKVDENAKDAGTQERLEYTKFLFEKTYKETVKKSPELQGVVVIFDSADGGMIAATSATLQQWTAGALSDAAMWHKCFFDPPETFDSSPSSGSK
jgi:hypothetical protein